jgi:DNA-binding transcriptional MerR regulator
MRPPAPHERLLRPGETAALFRVGLPALREWERRGLLTAIRTPGGERRYREAEVLARRAGLPWEPPQTD